MDCDAYADAHRDELVLTFDAAKSLAQPPTAHTYPKVSIRV